MRIEQSGMMTNGAGANPSTGVTSASQSSGQPSRQTPSVKEVKDMSATKKMEHYQLEAQKSSEENNADQEQQVIKAIEKANKHIKTFDRKLEFSIHEATKEIMVKVINTEDDSIIREIPSEKILDMVAHLWEMAGILVDEKR